MHPKPGPHARALAVLLAVVDGGGAATAVRGRSVRSIAQRFGYDFPCDGLGSPNWGMAMRKVKVLAGVPVPP